MTENEAIEALRLINVSRVHPFYSWEEMAEVRDMAISALKEIQQYREIGTVEECREAVELQKHLKGADNNLYKVLVKCSEYERIGTAEECREAVEKQKPEKPEIYTDTIQTISSSFNRDVYLCSRCGQFIGNIDDELPRYCNCCGQRIDEDLEGMEE